MIDFARRKWYYAAHSLILGAIVADFVSKYWVGRAVTGIARRAAERAAEGVVGASHAVVESYLRRAGIWEGMGLVLVLMGATCWVRSWKTHEQGTQALLIVLVATYVVCLFLIV
jgi:hypothetical protein